MVSSTCSIQSPNSARQGLKEDVVIFIAKWGFDPDRSRRSQLTKTPMAPVSAAWLTGCSPTHRAQPNPLGAAEYLCAEDMPGKRTAPDACPRFAARSDLNRRGVRCGWPDQSKRMANTPWILSFLRPGSRGSWYRGSDGYHRGQVAGKKKTGTLFRRV